MSHWSVQDWVTFFLAATPFIAGLAANIILVIKATRATTANTLDREVKATTSNVQLAAIASTVGAPVTVPQPEKLPSADPTPTAPVPPPTV